MHRFGVCLSGFSGQPLMYSTVAFHLTAFGEARGIRRNSSQNLRHVSRLVGVIVHASSRQRSLWAGELSNTDLSRRNSLIFLHMALLSPSSQILSMSTRICGGNAYATNCREEGSGNGHYLQTSCSRVVAQKELKNILRSKKRRNREKEGRGMHQCAPEGNMHARMSHELIVKEK